MKGEISMDKIKFAILMVVLIILFQTIFLINYYFAYVCIVLILLTWILEAKKIKKYSLVKKVTIYGFIILWFTLGYILFTLKLSSYISKFNFVIYSFIPIFIVSKILTYETIKEKIETNSKFLVLLIIGMFITSFLIMYGIYYLIETYFFDSNILLVICILNSTIFIIELFNILNIKIKEKGVVIIGTLLTIICLLIVNSIPISQINKDISIREKVVNIVNSNILTYQNIASELSPYVSSNVGNLLDGVLFDYQLFSSSTEFHLYYINTIIEKINKRNFNESLTRIQNQITQKAINSEKEDVIIRIVTSLESVILVVGIGIFTLKGKQ